VMMMMMGEVNMLTEIPTTSGRRHSRDENALSQNNLSDSFDAYGANMRGVAVEHRDGDCFSLRQLKQARVLVFNYLYLLSVPYSMD
jgi:hypothetical protein